jgi:hypothetical protein
VRPSAIAAWPPWEKPVTSVVVASERWRRAANACAARSMSSDALASLAACR